MLNRLFQNDTFMGRIGAGIAWVTPWAVTLLAGIMILNPGRFISPAVFIGVPKGLVLTGVMVAFLSGLVALPKATPIHTFSLTGSVFFLLSLAQPVVTVKGVSGALFTLAVSVVGGLVAYYISWQSQANDDP